MQIVETYNDKKYENSSGIHSGGSDLDSNYNIGANPNKNFPADSHSSSTELKSERSIFNDRFQCTSTKVFYSFILLDLRSK